MSILVKDLDPIIIVSKFGDRIREGQKEFHPGIDVRVADSKWRIHPVVAPEQMEITKIVFSEKWGHAVYARPTEQNELGIDEFRFWHQAPTEFCTEGMIFSDGAEFALPETKYIAAHLHFECRVKGQVIDPLLYLDLMGQEYNL